ncbi:MAG: alanine racemase, partial [Pseudomonadales bacterium]
LADVVVSMPNLRLRGLMAIPAIEDAERSFLQMRELYEQLITDGYALDTLSIGMSADYALAIKAGATMIRIGQALFGPRST